MTNQYVFFASLGKLERTGCDAPCFSPVAYSRHPLPFAFARSLRSAAFSETIVVDFWRFAVCWHLWVNYLWCRSHSISEIVLVSPFGCFSRGSGSYWLSSPWCPWSIPPLEPSAALALKFLVNFILEDCLSCQKHFLLYSWLNYYYLALVSWKNCWAWALKQCFTGS